MAKQFKVGDRVKLKKSGVKQFGNQSDGSVGVVKEPADGEGWYWVEWELGSGNNYQAKHLKSADKPEKPTLEEKTYEDNCGDLLEVDTSSSSDYVYFTTTEADDTTFDNGQIVRMTPTEVKKIRKQLKVWLDKHHTPV